MAEEEGNTKKKRKNSRDKERGKNKMIDGLDLRKYGCVFYPVRSK